VRAAGRSPEVDRRAPAHRPAASVQAKGTVLFRRIYENRGMT
jgi:hypothetical protein